MILRRTADHLQAQNWTTPGLELLVVIIGLFLVLQLIHRRVNGVSEQIKVYNRPLNAQSLISYSIRVMLFKAVKLN